MSACLDIQNLGAQRYEFSQFTNNRKLKFFQKVGVYVEIFSLFKSFLSREGLKTQ
jgi:hypothetical protein